MDARSPEITARTGLVGVLGHPVSHSLSPRMHNAAFKAQGVDMVYLAFDVRPDRLGQAVKGLVAMGVRGVNVTVPHKEAIIEYLDAIDPLAARIGAVNTVVNDQDRLHGYNTDVEGFLGALRSLVPGGAQGLRCFVAGAGGAARAVVAALMEDGASEVWIYNRTAARAEALCAAAAGWGPSTCGVAEVDTLSERIRVCDLLVNTTSVGLAASVKESAIPVDIVTSHHVVMDLVYGPSPTALVAGAGAKGAKVLDGKEMLARQAAGSYRLWTGLEPPVETMRQSLDDGER